VFLHSSQMLSVSTFVDTADICAIIHFVPHPCRHITVGQSHGSDDNVGKIPEISTQWGCKGSFLRTPPPRRKSLAGLHLEIVLASPLTRHYLVLCVLSTSVAKFVWDATHVFAVVIQTGILLKKVIITIIIQLGHQLISPTFE
jgi:hypothetical protein